MNQQQLSRLKKQLKKKRERMSNILQPAQTTVQAQAVIEIIIATNGQVIIQLKPPNINPMLVIGYMDLAHTQYKQHVMGQSQSQPTPSVVPASPEDLKGIDQAASQVAKSNGNPYGF